MLGRTIADLLSIEGRGATAPGLGMLEKRTALAPSKTLQPAILCRAMARGGGGRSAFPPPVRLSASRS